MGFGDFVGKIVGSALNEAKAAGERSKQYKEEMLGKSDYELASPDSARPLTGAMFESY